MERLPRKVYTYEFKLEAVRLVESGQRVAIGGSSILGRQQRELCSSVRWRPCG